VNGVNGEKLRLRQLQSIVQLDLINAITDKAVMTLKNGDVVILDNLGLTLPALNIQAVTSGSGIGSVQFGLDNNPNFRIEGFAPYALGGDVNGGDYNNCTELGLGPHNVTTTLFSGKGGTGTNLGMQTVSFTIVQSRPPEMTPVPAPVPNPTTGVPTRPPTLAPMPNPTTGVPIRPPTLAPVRPPTMAPVPVFVPLPVPSPTLAPVPATTLPPSYITAFRLIATPNTFVINLTDGIVVNLAMMGIPSGTTFNIEAVADPAVGAVFFTESNRREGFRPFAFCGDTNYGAIYYSCSEIKLGANRITATPILPNATSLPSISLNFTMVQGTPAPVPLPVPMPTLAPVVAPTLAPVPPPVPQSTSAPVQPTTLVPVPPPVPAPIPRLSTNGIWKIYNFTGAVARHENCFVMVGRKAYLIGGRETQDVDIFDPVTRTWSKGVQAPRLLHHMQCVHVNSEIYFPAAWTDWYPQETNVAVMYVFNTISNTWRNVTAMPEYRRRGAAAVVVDGTKIWVSHGNRGGHEQSTTNFATSYGWIDYYDTADGKWYLGDVMGFPDAPNPRDHTGGAFVNGRICVAAGRNGGVDQWPIVKQTDCFDPITKKWNDPPPPDHPDPRGGSNYGTSCDGHLIVSGGERSISSRVDVFNGTHWKKFQNGLIDSRHATGLAVDCVCNQIYMAAGSASDGGYPISTTEIYFPGGTDVACLA
jgi:hypothetical protein